MSAHTPEYQAALDAAWRTVDALGGTFNKDDPFAAGYDNALENACRAITTLGARDPDVVRAELLSTVRMFAEESGWRGKGPNDRDQFYCEFCGATHLDYTLVAHAESCPITKARAAIAKATGAA